MWNDTDPKYKESYMECAELTRYHGYLNRRNKLSRLDMNYGYMGNRYPIYVSLPDQL